MNRISIILIALIIQLANVKAQNEGELAPNFTYKSINGNDISLSDYRGKVVFIFSFGYNCFNCRNASPIVENNVLKNYADNADVVYLAIDLWDGSNTQVQDFINRTGLDMQFLIKGSSLRSLWDTSYDRLFVVDAQGVLVYKGGGDGAAQQVSQASSAINSALKSVASSVNTIESNSFKSNVFPNPVVHAASVNYTLENASAIDITILDVSGKVVKSIENGYRSAGAHTINFSVEELRKGMYFVKLHARNQTTYTKFVVQ